MATLTRVVWTQKVRQVAKWRRSSELSFDPSHLTHHHIGCSEEQTGSFLTLTRCFARRCTRSRGQVAPPLISPAKDILDLNQPGKLVCRPGLLLKKVEIKDEDQSTARRSKLKAKISFARRMYVYSLHVIITFCLFVCLKDFKKKAPAEL